MSAAHVITVVNRRH